MRLVTSLVLVGCLTSPVIALQTPRGGAAGARISACSLITPDIAAKYIDKRILPHLTPEEAQAGAVGTSCEYGRIGLQVDPFGRGTLPRAPNAQWQPVPALGDGAFFRPNGQQYAELIAWTGPHHLTIQLGAATGATMDVTKTEAIALARAILPKLK